MSLQLVPYLNPETFGDKIVLGASVALLRADGHEVWGIEGEEFPSMELYASPPTRTLRGPVRETLLRALEERPDAEVRCFVDYNSTLPDLHAERIYRARIHTADLWDTARTAAARGIHPSLRLPEGAREAAAALLGEAGEPLVVMHVRDLPRESWKNTDVALYAALARTLGARGVRVVFVGKRAGALLDGSNVLDLSTGTLPFPSMAGIIASARVFVGSDSGPSHLAAALGVSFLGLGYLTDAYGPFAPPERILDMFGPEERGKVRVQPMPDEIAERICAW